MQTGCFLRSSPKAGLNAVLIRRIIINLYAHHTNDRLLLLFGLYATAVVYVAGVLPA